jgi:hypothetical protein
VLEPNLKQSTKAWWSLCQERDNLRLARALEDQAGPECRENRATQAYPGFLVTLVRLCILVLPENKTKKLDSYN